MARNKDKAAEDFTDVPEIEPTGAGFANNPIPPQQIIDQEAAAQPVTTEPIVLGRPPRRKTASPGSPTSAPVRRRDAQQIINEFLAEINGHPDFMMLTSSLGGRPDKATEFPSTPRLNQHKAELRFVWRDAAPEVQQVDQAAPSPFQPGGKYYDLVPRKGDVEPVEPPNDGPKPWDNLVKKRELETATP